MEVLITSLPKNDALTGIAHSTNVIDRFDAARFHQNLSQLKQVAL